MNADEDHHRYGLRQDRDSTAYDKARTLTPETLRFWQDLLSVKIDRAANIVGDRPWLRRGALLRAIGNAFDVQVIGIDPPRKMIDQAQFGPVPIGTAAAEIIVGRTRPRQTV